jgi:hypothetical protein
MILQKKYPFNHFQDGELINDLWREWMRSGRPELVAIKNPFVMRRAQRKKIERSIQPNLINTEPTLKPEIVVQTSIEKFKNLVSKIISQPCYQEGFKNLPVQ